MTELHLFAQKAAEAIAARMKPGRLVLREGGRRWKTGYVNFEAEQADLAVEALARFAARRRWKKYLVFRDRPTTPHAIVNHRGVSVRAVSQYQMGNDRTPEGMLCRLDVIGARA